ncbi:MAG: hypothetical protein GOV15_04890, partial [Candidatus Diapherotrites archaeon]|nr:hypothetical protein [Candidatus Diapherotrites archaeon]
KNPAKPDFAVVVDTGAKVLLPYPSLKRFDGPLIVLDHHFGFDLDKENMLVYIDEAAVSTTMVVFDLFKKAKVKVSENVAALLALGIISDSARFAVSSSKTFKAIAELLDLSGKTYLNLLGMHHERGVDERIALIKAARRTKAFRVDDFLIVTSELGSFKGLAANALVELGADVAFVLGDSKDSSVVSSRASSHFLDHTGLDLGHIMTHLGAQFGGDGGGHPGAAAFSFTDPYKKKIALKKCIDAVVLELDKHGKLSGRNVQEY